MTKRKYADDRRKIGNKKKRNRKGIYYNKLTFFMIVFIAVIYLSIFGDKESVRAYDNLDEESSDCRYYKCIQVNDGDTLWDIAALYMDDSYDSASDYIEELKTINKLNSDKIHAGCYLTVSYKAPGDSR